MTRGEQGRPEDAAAEAAETGTATPGRSLTTASIPEHPSGHGVRQNGVGLSAADLSSLAGADVSLAHGGSPQLAQDDLPAAPASTSAAPDAAATGSAQLGSHDPVYSAADPSSGNGTAAGPADGASTAGPAASSLGEAPDATAGPSDSMTSISAAGVDADLRRSVTVNPLFEPEAADDGPPAQAATTTGASAEPASEADGVQAGPAASTGHGAPEALQHSSQVFGEGSGHMRVRQRSGEAHPSILRHSTWTDLDAA